MKVDIYIREVNWSTKREIRIPWLPELINVDTGEASMTSYDILNLGEVAIPTGVGLSTYSWEATFPGSHREDLGMLHGKKQSPAVYDSLFKYWKEKRAKLHLMVTGYPINIDVYLTKYTSKAVGGFGDIEYSVSFTEAKEITVVSTKNNAKKTVPKLKRPTASSNATSTYVVKRGDTLWGIAQNRLNNGLKWADIYNDNKTVIENVAKKHGKSSSGKGHWIYPGTTLLVR